MKQNLLNELCYKKDLDELAVRVSNAEKILVFEGDRITENTRVIEKRTEILNGQQVLLKSHTDLIQELQNQVRKCETLLKYKVDGDEIDSMSTLMNELYQRLLQLENTTGHGD